MDRFTEEGPGDLARSARQSREREDDGRGELRAQLAAETALLRHMHAGLAKIDAAFPEWRTDRALRGYLGGAK